MGELLRLSRALTTVDCGNCGGSYAINERYRREREQARGFWTCPYCKCSWGYGEGENDRLRRELVAERSRKELALARENQERAAKEKLARKLNRVGRGVCPECNRSFQNLALHMNCKHGGVDGKSGKVKLR